MIVELLKEEEIDDIKTPLMILPLVRAPRDRSYENCMLQNEGYELEGWDGLEISVNEVDFISANNGIGVKKTCNNIKNLSEFNLEHEKEDELWCGGRGGALILLGIGWISTLGGTEVGDSFWGKEVMVFRVDGFALSILV
ncbi:hypothetical protein Tco_0489685 [Tanacetum coccineum]